MNNKLFIKDGEIRTELGNKVLAELRKEMRNVFVKYADMGYNKRDLIYLLFEEIGQLMFIYELSKDLGNDINEMI